MSKEVVAKGGSARLVDLYTAAAELEISYNAVWKLCVRGVIPSVKLLAGRNGPRRIPRDALEQFKAGRSGRSVPLRLLDSSFRSG